MSCLNSMQVSRVVDYRVRLSPIYSFFFSPVTLPQVESVVSGDQITFPPVYLHHIGVTDWGLALLYCVDFRQAFFLLHFVQASRIEWQRWALMSFSPNGRPRSRIFWGCYQFLFFSYHEVVDFSGSYFVFILDLLVTYFG